MRSLPNARSQSNSRPSILQYDTSLSFIRNSFSGGPGSFLVRPSDNSPGDYSLFFHINNQIQRFRVEKKGVRYVMGGRTFDCLEAVINRYKTEQIVEGHTLGHCIKRVSESLQLASSLCMSRCATPLAFLSLFVFVCSTWHDFVYHLRTRRRRNAV